MKPFLNGKSGVTREIKKTIAVRAAKKKLNSLNLKFVGS